MSCLIPNPKQASLHYLVNIKIDWYLSVYVALSDGLVLTSDSESEVFCDSMEQLDYIKVWSSEVDLFHSWQHQLMLIVRYAQLTTYSLYSRLTNSLVLSHTVGRIIMWTTHLASRWLSWVLGRVEKELRMDHHQGEETKEETEWGMVRGELLVSAKQIWI